MSSATEVYVVTRGEYSAYGIMRVFLDKTAAEGFVKLVNDGSAGFHDKASIETWVDGALQPGEHGVWKIEIYPEDAGVLYWYWQAEETSYYEIGELNSSGIWIRDNDPDWIQVYARDLEKGKKVVHDLIAEHKAKKAGLT